jgi:hypothetical protein
VVQRARSYIGVPFQHQGRGQGHGVDCVGVPICVAADLGLKDKRGNAFDRFRDSDYPAQPMSDLVLRMCREYLIERAGVREINDGDVLCILSPIAIHAAIASTLPGPFRGMIHLYDAGKGSRVVEHILNDKWRRRIAGVFYFPGVVS